jgi:large subunit ribosomal protein L23
MRYSEIIIRPILTEKSYAGMSAETNQIFTFEVARDANKLQVKEAVEKLFEVKVERVNIVNVKPKTKRVGKYTGKTNRIKKAIVKLTADSKIDLQ